MDHRTEDSDSEEEILIYADFKELLDSETMKPGKIQIFKAIAMDTESPIVQLNNYFFQGDYHQCLGTNLFLEEDLDPPERDPIFEIPPEIPLKYVCKTRKIMTMKRIFLNRTEDATEGTKCNENIELETHASSVEEAMAKFRTYFETNEKDLGPYTEAPTEDDVTNFKPIPTGTRQFRRRIDSDESDSN